MNAKVLRLAIWLAAGLGLAALHSVAEGAAPMADINMTGTQMESGPARVASPVLTITVRPNPPVMGANTLDIVAANPANGKPVTGMKLRSIVAMTSMDMGTAHPVVDDLGEGKYRTVVNFAMNGPWRVTILGDGPAGKFSESFDFDAGGKTPWTQPQPDVSNADHGAMAPSMNAGATGKNGADAGMTETAANSRSDMGVPILKPERVFTVTGNQNLKAMSGFGHNAPMVGMMNLMMVEGSGMESMKMSPMKLDFGPQNFAPPAPGEAETLVPAAAHSPRSTTDTTPALTTMTPAEPAAAVGVPAAALKISAAVPAPKVGDNNLDIMLTDANGAPVAGATISTSVAMMSMDMGTSHPPVNDMSKGRYVAKVNFSMAGPWRVVVHVTPPGQKPTTRSFEFDAKE